MNLIFYMVHVEKGPIFNDVRGIWFEGIFWATSDRLRNLLVDCHTQWTVDVSTRMLS